jgi:diguanylate cyclase
MLLLIDLTFLLLAAVGGAAAMWLVLALRGSPAAEPFDVQETHFAQETLARLQDLTRRVAAEVDQHSECVEEINAQLSNSDDNDEAAVLAAVTQLIDANQRMQHQLDSAEERLKTQAQQMESHAVEARTDALTHIANRRALDDELTRCALDFERRGTPTTVMLLDVDHFKKFNDEHGHPAGDDVLRTVARVVHHAVSDVGVVARYGGEEFAVVFAGLTAAAAIPYGERARLAIGAAAVRVGDRNLHVTASAGMAEMLIPDNDDALGRADEALYVSKKAGRDRGHFNDGRTNHLIKLEVPFANESPLPPSLEKTGDEWLYEADVPTQALFSEPIANVSNRPAFFDDLIRRLAHWRRGGNPLTVVLLQVDNFSHIVETHGHSAADVVLRIMAQLVNAIMRDMDHVARLSEDTFALLLPGALLKDGVSLGERLRQAVERCRLPRKAGVSAFTISVGVVEAGNGDDLHRLLQRVRRALAAAISQGRNCVVGRDSMGTQVSHEESAVL